MGTSNHDHRTIKCVCGKILRRCRCAAVRKPVSIVSPCIHGVREAGERDDLRARIAALEAENARLRSCHNPEVCVDVQEYADTMKLKYEVSQEALAECLTEFRKEREWIEDENARLVELVRFWAKQVVGPCRCCRKCGAPIPCVAWINDPGEECDGTCFCVEVRSTDKIGGE